MCKCVHILLRNQDENLARTTWMRLRKLVPSRRCTVLPLTSTDMASEVVMSLRCPARSFSAAVCLPLVRRVFSSVSLLISAYVQTCCPLLHLSFVRLLSFVSLRRKGRSSVRGRALNRPSEVQLQSGQYTKYVYIAAVVRRANASTRTSDD